jgi:predicted Fe-Mo cluster-binding NifX family protein
MKLILPVDADQNLISVTFGRAPYFVVYNTETGTHAVHRNPAASAQGGAGLKAAQFVADCQVDAMITARCGLNSAEVLKAAGITIYKSDSLSVKQNILDFQEGKLPVMNEFSAGHPGGR